MKNPENQRIEIVRIFLGMTQKEFAESIGMKQPNYQKAIKDGNTISGRPIYLLSSTHRVNLDWIFGKIESEMPVFQPLKQEDDSLVRELEKKLLKVQEELIEYKTNENTRLKNIEGVPLQP